MNQKVLLILLVTIMENVDMSRLNFQTLTKPKIKVLTGKRKTRPRRDLHTLLGKIMMVQQVTQHKKKVKKRTCVSWLKIRMIIVNYCKLFEELYDEENIIVVINN